MGIEYLDIMFRVEKRFGFKITRDEFAVLADTAGSMHQYIWDRLQGRQPFVPDFKGIAQRVDQWINARVDVRKRRSFGWCRAARVNRLELAVWQGDPRARWSELADWLGCPLPRLQADEAGGRPRLPALCQDQGELTIWLCLHQPRIVPPITEAGEAPPPPGAEQWTFQSSWQAVCEILVASLGVKPEEVVPHAHLIRDLGMG